MKTLALTTESMEGITEDDVICLLTEILDTLRVLSDTKQHFALQNSDLQDVQQKLWQMKVSGNEVWSANIRDLLSHIISGIIILAKIPDRNDSDVPEATTINYEVCINNAVHSFYTLNILVKQLMDHKAVIHKTAEWLQNSIVIPCLVFCATYDEVCLWSNEKTSQCCKDVTKGILNLTEYTDIRQMMEGGSGVFPEGISKPLMMSFMPHLTREMWKQNPTTKIAFAWCLVKIKHPHLGNLLSEVLPPPLIFVDDYVLENKILGVNCLHHIIQNVSPSELKWYGRAEVVYNALEHLLYTHEAALISVLHPCLLSALYVVEDDPTKPSSLAKISRYDKVLEKILTDMELEQRLMLRRAFAEHVYLFIEKLGINAVRHIKHLLRVISEYLEVSDGPEEHSRKVMLFALKSLILTTWPRMSYHMETILKILLKLIYDIHTTGAQVEVKEQRELTRLATECLELLKKIDPKQFQLLCEPLLEVQPDIPGREIFDQIVKASV